MTSETEFKEKWTAAAIARTILLQQFARKMLVLVPNCNWTGHECDMLCVTKDLRIVDVEIKISRADLLRESIKEKWYDKWDWRKDVPAGANPLGSPRKWPPKVWKHYLAMPWEVYDTGVLDKVPECSGILVLDTTRGGVRRVTEMRKAVPCRTAEKIDAADAIDIARLAGLRMWDALMKLEGCEVRAKKWEEARAKTLGGCCD